MTNRETVTATTSILSDSLQLEEEQLQPLEIASDSTLKYPNRNSNQSQPATDRPKKSGKRRNLIKPIIMLLTFLALLLPLGAQLNTLVGMGVNYTDNAFQLSEYDLTRVADGHPNFNYIKASDDIQLSAKVRAGYYLYWQWWQIEPMLRCLATQNILNPDKHKLDTTLGIRFKRKLGSLGMYYAYSPFNYLRKYTDDDGTLEQEKFDYQKNTYRAELQLKPLPKSTLLLDYRFDQYRYNQYFTEYDGDADTWTLGWQQAFTNFEVGADYSYKVFDTGRKASLEHPEDSSYESNAYDVSLSLKKTRVDDKKPDLLWRPTFSLGYEERFYSGLDTWHEGRTDWIYDMDATLQFYLHKNWNINLDYSYQFRNVEAVSLSVGKYKEYGENRIGAAAEYSF